MRTMGTSDRSTGKHTYSRQVAGPANDDLFAGFEWELASDFGSDGSAPLKVLYPADLSEVLSRTEDLWMRIKRHSACHLHIARDREMDTHLVLMRYWTTKRDDEAETLLQAVQDTNTYAWMQELQDYGMAQPHNLVKGISWAGGVLVVELMPMNRLIRQCGLDVEWQVQGMLDRVQLRSLTHAASVEPSMEAPSADIAIEDHWQARMRALKVEIDALDA